MKFLVDVTPHIPPEMPPETLTGLLARETDAAIDLMQRGKLLQIHRVAGRGGNIGLWEADTLEELDQILNDLPMAPYLSFHITSLIKHRVQKVYEERLLK